MSVNQAVLTGDLVDSTGAGPQRVDRAMHLLSTTADDIARWPVGAGGAIGNTRFTRFRGDGWQMLIPAARLGLRAALVIHARLAANPDLPATRIAAGIAGIDRVPGPDLADAHGAAFAISGRTLAQMDRGSRLRLAGHAVTPLVSSLLDLLDDRIADWTPEQAEAMAHVLPPRAPTQAAIAATLGISPQALSARLAGARWPRIRAVLTEWERPEPPEGMPKGMPKGKPA